MKRWIKSVLFFCLYFSGIEFLLSKLVPSRAVAILMYHGVSDNAAMPAEVNFHLPQKVFDRQMRALRRRYSILRLSAVIADLKSGKQLKKGVVLTFDDGYSNNLYCVMPILKRLGMPFTVFISTEYLQHRRWIPLNEVYWLWSEGKLSKEQTLRLRESIRSTTSKKRKQILERLERPDTVSAAAMQSFGMLSWEEVLELAHNDVEIGSHTHSHCNMAVEDEADQLTELYTSKRLLEDSLARPVVLFAYPYGRAEHFSDASRENVIRAGYHCALSTEDGLVTSQSDRFCLPRIGYDTRMWVFTGELLYRFILQAIKPK